MVRFTKPSNMTIYIEDCAIGDSFVENGLSKKKKCLLSVTDRVEVGVYHFYPTAEQSYSTSFCCQEKKKLARRTCSNFLLMDGWMDG